jgi:murein L,D-transpeptidase YcbB/YkuD
MSYLKLILFILVFVTFTKCKTDSSFFIDDKPSLSQQLHHEIENNSELIFGSDTLLAKKEIFNYYSENDYQPIWINDSALNTKGKDMLWLIENAYNYGLLPEFFSSKAIHKYKDTSIFKTELLLSNSYLLYITHLNVGFLDTNTMQYSWKKDSVDYNWNDKLNEIKTTTDIKKLVVSYQPDNWEYLQLQKGLEKFVTKHPLDTIHIKIPKFKDDSVKCYQIAKQSLIIHHFLTDSTENDSIYLEKLKEFQLINGLKDDAIIGTWTSKMLEMSNYDRFYQAMLSLEKWRWKKQEDFPERYIRVNVPAFQLKLWDDNKVIAEHRVVVGKFDTQTPEFHAKLRRMVTNPFWHLPYSIASTEFLAHAKKDTSYFSKKGYKVFRNGNEVDPKTVDWNAINESNFRYRVRQDGGNGNSLGRLKFLFPNPYSVFLHDTPSKRLFSNDVRAYSHGCVRLHRPFELGETILKIDENNIPSDSLVPIINRGEQKVIELKHPFEVYIEYYTASADSSGNIIFHPDIYNRDVRFLKNIRN